MTEVVKNMFQFRSSGKRLPFQRGIIQNNNALPLLLKYVEDNYNMQFILTTKLNQDCLENFFSAIRAKGGLHDHPSPLEFKYRFRSYLLDIYNSLFLITKIHYWLFVEMFATLTNRNTLNFAKIILRNIK